MNLYSAGQTADLLGVHRDAIQAGIRAGAPEATFRVANKRCFTQEDILALRRWFQAQGKRVNVVYFKEPVGA